MPPYNALRASRTALGRLVLTGILIASGAPLRAQWEAPVQPHRGALAFGDVTLDATLHFRSADRWLGGGTLAEAFQAEDALGLFDTEGRLAAALSALGASTSPLLAGPTDAAIQVSQSRLPLTLRAGLPWNLELEATMRFVRTRLEADTRLLASPDATLGRSPALDESTAVQEFVDEVVAATEGFSADGRDWAGWGEAWRSAYRASVLFPTAESGAALQLLAEAEALNAALAADGRAAVGRTPLFAGAALDSDAYLALTTGAPYGLIRFDAAPYIWKNGDVDVVLHRRIGPDATDSAASWAVKASGGVRLPFARQADPDLLFSTAAGEGVLAGLAGVDGWMTRGRLGLSGSLRATLHSSTEVVRRIGPIDEVLVGRDSRTGVSWTPGTRLLGHLRAEFTPSGPLRLEVGYTFDLRTDDTYERLGPVPQIDGTQAFPAPTLYTDASLLGAGTGGTAHWVRAGVRWLPVDDGSFGVAFDVGAPVAGEIPRAYEWTELRLRAYRTIRLPDLFD